MCRVISHKYGQSDHARVIHQSRSEAVGPDDGVVRLEPTKSVFLTVVYRQRAVVDLACANFSLFSAVQRAYEAHLVIPQGTGLLGGGSRPDDILVGVRSFEDLKFFAIEVLERELALSAGACVWARPESIGPPDFTVGHERSRDPGVSVVDEALTVDMEAHSARIVTVGADFVALFVEVEHIHALLVFVPAPHDLISHLVHVIE